MCAIDLTESKGRLSTYLLLTPLYDLRPSTAGSISGEQRVLVFPGSAGRPHHFLQISDSNLLVLWLHILVHLASCVYVHNL